MKLPNAHRAVVEREKITDYLLNPEHPGNGGKARLFQSLGFTREDWQAMAAALRKSSETAEIIDFVKSPHGRKYIQRGEIESPQGKRRIIRMVWIVEEEGDSPRLVTAYPEG